MKRSSSSHGVMTFLAFLIAFLATHADTSAQRLSTARIEVTASIPTSVSLVADRNLQLGVLQPGVSETIDPLQSGAGRLVLTGPPGASVYVTFSLPTHLVGVQDSLPISFDRQSVRLSGTSWESGDGKVLDPNNGFMARISDGTTGVAGQMALALGCTVNPKRDQRPGDYMGEVRVTVVYTGD
jgi:hypothetical protein